MTIIIPVVTPGAMTRLQLCQRTARECGLAGSAMTTTIGATGENAQIVGWVDDAWSRIQSSRNWDWLWEAATITITANTSTTASSIPASRYEHDRATDSSGSPMCYLPWAEFTSAYPAALIQAGNPRTWTIRPDKAFAVNAKPTSAFNVSVERYTNPTAMTLDASVPDGLPGEYHMLIVWRAVMLYAGHDEAGALYQHANAEYRKVLAAMGVTELPAIEFGGDW